MTVTVCSFGRDGSKKILFALELNNKIIDFIFSIHFFDLVHFVTDNNVLGIFLGHLFRKRSAVEFHCHKGDVT